MISLDDIKLEIEKECGNGSITPSDGFLFCKEYIDNNRVFDIDQFLKIDIWECLKCMDYIKSDGRKTIDESISFFDFLKERLGKLDYIKLRSIVDMIFLIADFKENDIVFKYLREEDPEKAEVILNLINDSRIDSILFFANDGFVGYKSILKDLKRLFPGEDIFRLMSYIHEDENHATEIFSFLKIYKQANYDTNRLNAVINKRKDINRSLKRKIRDELYDKYYDVDRIIGEHNIISNYVSCEGQKIRDIIRQRKRIKSGYALTMSLLEKESKNDEIKKTREIVKYASSDKVKRMIVQYVVEHNQRYYDSLSSEFNELSSNSINLYNRVFIKYHIRLSHEQIRDFMHIPLNDLEFMLETCVRNRFDEKETLYIIKHSNRDMIELIKKYIELGYLSISFLKDNISFFDESKDYFNQFIEGLELIGRYGLNPQIFGKDPAVLIINYELLKTNLAILNEYECIKNMKNASIYNFLLDSDLTFKLDKMIELGFYDFLSEDMDILNRDKNRFLRFDLLNVMSMPVVDKKDFMEVIDSNKFIVPDDEIENYLLDLSKYHGDDPFFTMEEIEENKVNSLTVSINDQLISYLKIKRLLREGYSIKEAVCYGKYFTEGEYQSFINGNSSIY